MFESTGLGKKDGKEVIIIDELEFEEQTAKFEPPITDIKEFKRKYKKFDKFFGAAFNVLDNAFPGENLNKLLFFLCCSGVYMDQHFTIIVSGFMNKEFTHALLRIFPKKDVCSYYGDKKNLLEKLDKGDIKILHITDFQNTGIKKLVTNITDSPYGFEVFLRNDKFTIPKTTIIINEDLSKIPPNLLRRSIVINLTDSQYQAELISENFSFRHELDCKSKDLILLHTCMKATEGFRQVESTILPYEMFLRDFFNKDLLCSVQQILFLTLIKIVACYNKSKRGSVLANNSESVCVANIKDGEFIYDIAGDVFMSYSLDLPASLNCLVQFIIQWIRNGSSIRKESDEYPDDAGYFPRSYLIKDYIRYLKLDSGLNHLLRSERQFIRYIERLVDLGVLYAKESKPKMYRLLLEPPIGRFDYTKEIKNIFKDKKAKK